MKLLRAIKKFGRCRIHGSNCGVAHEIQSIPISRAKEKADLRKDIKSEKENCDALRNNPAGIIGWL